MLKRSVLFSFAIICFIVFAMVLSHNFYGNRQLEISGIITIAAFLSLMLYEVFYQKLYNMAIAGHTPKTRAPLHGPERHTAGAARHDKTPGLEAHRQQDEKYRYMFEKNPSPMYTFDLEEYKVMEANDASLEKYGYTREEFIGMDVEKLRKDPKSTLAQLNEYVKENNIDHYKSEAWHIKKDGSLIYVDASVFFLNENGKRIALASVTDITEKKMAEEALRQSEEKYRNIFENNPFPKFLFELEAFKIINVNSAAVEKYGYTREEFLSMTLDQIRSEKEEKRIIDLAEYVRKNNIPNYRGKAWHVRKDGTEMFMEVSTYFTSDNGKKVGLAMVNDVTVHKKAEEALHFSEEKYRVIFEKNPLPMFMINPDTLDIMDANNAAIKDYGYTIEEFKNLNVSDIRFDEQDGLSKDEVKSLVNKDHKIHNGAALHRKKDGSLINIELTVFLIKVSGETVRLAICNDVTEKKKTEDALQQSEANLKALIENTSDAIWAVDADGILMAINAANQNLYYAIHQVWLEKGMDIFKDLEGEMRQVAMESFKKVLRGEALKYERSYLINGNPVYYEVSVNPIVTATGEITGASYFSHDITERKLAEIELKKNEEKYRLLIETMHEGLLYVDNDDNVQFANDKFLEMTGYSADEIKGKQHLSLLFDEPTRDIILDKSKLRLKGISDNYEIQIIRKNGDKVWVLVNGSPLYNSNNEVIGLIATFIDINERKIAENKMIAKNKELDEFAYIVSHDLKAPLRAINNLSEWIEDDLGDNLPPDTKQNVELMRGRVRRMEMLINGILEYSRIGRNKTRVERIEIKDFLKDVVDLLSPPNTFTIDIQAKVQPFYAEKIKLQQVFSNLVGNAVKHHDSAEGRITIHAKETGDFCEFIVEDNGPGIEPQYHEKVFAIFQTLKPKDTVESTGIGLTIVKKIIEENGGAIRLESEFGKGSKFIFTWEKKKPDEEPEE